MKQVKQKTVNGTTLKLVRQKNPLKSSKYVYELRNGQGQVIEEDAGTNKQEAMKDFRNTVELYKNDSSMQERKDGFLGEPLL